MFDLDKEDLDEVNVLGEIEKVEDEIAYIQNLRTKIDEDKVVSRSTMERIVTPLPFSWESNRYPLADFTEDPSPHNVELSLEATAAVALFLFKAWLFFMGIYLTFRMGFFISDKIFERLELLLGLEGKAKESKEKVDGLVNSTVSAIADKTGAAKFKKLVDHVELDISDIKGGR